MQLLQDTIKENDMKTLESILESIDGYGCCTTACNNTDATEIETDTEAEYLALKARKKKSAQKRRDATPPVPPPPPPSQLPPPLSLLPSATTTTTTPPKPSAPPPPPPLSLLALFGGNEQQKNDAVKDIEKKQEREQQPASAKNAKTGLQQTNSSDFTMRCFSTLSRFSFFFNPSSAASKSSPSLPKTSPSTVIPAVQRSKSMPMFPTHTAKPATRESVAHSIWLLAQSARQRHDATIALKDMPAKLFAISDAIGAVPDSAFEEALLAKQLSAIATRCSLFDTRMAADICLIVADYNEFVLGYHNDAANALERAVQYIDSNDVRRVVGLLQQSGRLYEKGTQFDQALRVERKLEPFDLSVDWSKDSRARQCELAARLQK